MKAGKQPWVSAGNLRAGRPRVTHKAGHNKANCRCKVVCFAGIVNIVKLAPQNNCANKVFRIAQGRETREKVGHGVRQIFENYEVD